MPFGLLSNNSIYVMEIDGKKYNTVTNYIYANLLNNPEYFSILQNINTHEVHKYFNKYDKENIIKIITNALKEAVDMKLKNKKLEELLFTTENYPIIYRSNDNILGITKQGIGLNLLGKYLVEIRAEISKKYETTEKRMYNAYVALTLLEKLISSENNDLSDFVGLDQNEIINKYIYIKALLVSKTQGVDLSKMTQEQIIESYKYFVQYPDKNILESLTIGDNIKILKLLEVSLRNPYILVLYVRKKYINNLRSTQQNRIKNSIFDIYVDNLIQTKFPVLPKNKYEEAKNKELNIDYRELEVLKEQITDFYKEKILPAEVMERVINEVKFDNLVSEEEIRRIEEEDINKLYIIDEEEKKEAIVFEDMKNGEINNNPYSVFSPTYYSEMFTINNNKYPTIIHYIIANLFASIPDINNLNNAHNYLLIDMFGDKNDVLNYDDKDSLMNLYKDNKYNTYNQLRKKLTSIGLNKKFENQSLIDLLLVTGNKTLIWNDPQDDILGEGFSKGGENFVGTYLAQLRHKFIKTQEETENINEEDILKIIENDVFIRNWLEMRLNDICRVVKHVHKYMIDKHNLTSGERIEVKYNKRWKPAKIISINTDNTYIVKFNNGVVENNVPKSDIKILAGDSFEITFEFINIVLDNVYQPCQELMQEVRYLDIQPPAYFINLVKKCLKIKIDPEINTLLWKRIVIMIYFVLKYVPKFNNVKNVLTKLELITSRKANCVKVINNNLDNCIISAIVNIIKGLVEVNNLYDYEVKFEKIDIVTAINIILNRKEIKLKDVGKDMFSNIEGEDKTGLTDIDFTQDLTTIGDMNEGEEPGYISDYDVYAEGEDDSEDEDKYANYGYEEEDNSIEKEDMDNEDGMESKTFNKPIKFKEEQDKLDRKRFEKQKNINKISLFLDSNGFISKDNKLLAEYIFDSVNIIKNYKMSYKVKMNRINFFATTLS